MNWREVAELPFKHGSNQESPIQQIKDSCGFELVIHGLNRCCVWRAHLAWIAYP